VTYGVDHYRSVWCWHDSWNRFATGGIVVKQVDALIRPSSLAAVMTALDRFDVGGATVSEVTVSDDDAFGVSYRGKAYVVNTRPMLRVEVVTTDASAGPIAWAVATAARLGRSDDGVVFIETVEEAVRIGNGERGVAALSARPDVEGADEVAPAREVHPAGARRVPRADWTKVLLTNVVLATVVPVVLFHAPIGSAALGAGGVGLLLWARERRRTR
jgi:nitrogen regulatory protein P-II 1